MAATLIYSPLEKLTIVIAFASAYTQSTGGVKNHPENCRRSLIAGGADDAG